MAEDVGAVFDADDERREAAKRVGEVIANKYELRAVIGTGGMGAVYEAVHRFTRREVAIKLLHAHVATQRNVARMVREAQAASSIKHPGIVQVLDAGNDTAGVPYLVMERLRGEDFASALTRGRMRPALLVRVTVQLLDVLAAAHAQGFVHRDIKPENIFLEGSLTGEPRVRLLDFGVARDIAGGSASLTATGAVVGTPWFMSPEQARGEPVDARADLWSVGAMMFECLAGRPPFDGENYNLVVSAILYEDAPSLSKLCPGLPTELVEFVDRALRKNLAERWSSATEMRDRLRAIDRLPSIAPPPRNSRERAAAARAATPAASVAVPAPAAPAPGGVVAAKAAPSETTMRLPASTATADDHSGAATVSSSRWLRPAVWLGALVAAALAAGGFIASRGGSAAQTVAPRAAVAPVVVAAPVPPPAVAPAPPQAQPPAVAAPPPAVPASAPSTVQRRVGAAPVAVRPATPSAGTAPRPADPAAHGNATDDSAAARRRRPSEFFRSYE